MLPPPLAIPPQLAGRMRAAGSFLIGHGGLLVCALFALAGLVLAGDYGINFDERPQRYIAAANLDYILGQADSLDNLEYPLAFYGVAFELPLLLAERALGLEDYYYVHRLRLTLTHLLFIIGGFFCYRLTGQLFGSRLIALFALLVYLLHPRLYAHSFLNSKDLPFLSMFAIALYLLERAGRRDTAGAYALLGMAVGLLVNLRIMGLMLFFAVIAMRGLDWFYARGGPERKGILRRGGLFILAAGLTAYALSPYAWANPGDYLATSLGLTVNHPGVILQLFQGKWHFTNEFPPHYAATWFAITTPPPILLLGGLGAAAAAAGLRRPGPALGPGRRRFALLLLACCLLPPPAAVLLGSIQNDDWRHFYFLYVPFLLLAAGGLHWLTGARFRRRPGRAGVYGLAGLGLGLILLQLAQLHPLQSIYFNFLVDRTAPEYLRTRYHLDPWYLAPRAALERLLARHPEATFVVRAAAHDLEVLPPAARRRLLLPGGGRRADYELVNKGEPGRPDQSFNYRYSRLYNNTLIGLRPLKESLMTPAAAAAYREIYRQAVAGEPIIRADYEVYRQGRRLTFVKENCPAESRDAAFGARVFPRAREIPPPDLTEVRWHISYNLSNNGVRLGKVCLAVIQLPAYIRGDLVISQSNLGRFHRVGLVWEELYSLAPPGLRERIARLRQDRPPAPPEAFEVFLDRDGGGGNRLIYAKGECAQGEYETPTFLHIIPENRGDLPFYQWQSGVDNRDFLLPRYGVRPGGECLAVVPLPDYPIAAIRTGQAGVWETQLYPPADRERLRATYAALSAVQPAASTADFALYVQDNRLIYLRETCAAADTAANFFLHIIPQEVAALPAERRYAGFANLDFPFARYGGAFDGKCLATVPLSDYPIKSLRTGQYVPGQGELWAAEVMAGR